MKEDLNIILVQSTDIHEYRSVMEELTEDFGTVFYSAILTWCEIIDLGDKEKTYWNVWLIYRTGFQDPIGICGLYQLENGNKDEYWLGWFGLNIEQRHQGIGTEVLRRLEEIARKDGMKYLKTYVDAHGKPIPFYERNGFSVNYYVKTYLEMYPHISKEEFGSGEDYVLSKKLEPIGEI